MVGYRQTDLFDALLMLLCFEIPVQVSLMKRARDCFYCYLTEEDYYSYSYTLSFPYIHVIVNLRSVKRSSKEFRIACDHRFSWLWILSNDIGIIHY